ncbi:phosphatase PAP2 family protein [Methylorubrum extorquens]|uniref:phosphatase PAP2 family protein n=1 Tax=Methylorubrum extorquens TaxID=408 RepID=UPI003F6224A6
MFQLLSLNRWADAPGPSPCTYGMVAFLIAAALCVQYFSGVWLHASLPLYLVPVLILTGIAYLHSRSFRGPRLLAVLALLAVLQVQALCITTLAYSVQALAFPLRDDLFIAIDNSLGFDWLRFQRYMVEKDELIALLGLCYDTFLPQVVLTPIVLGALGSDDRADRYVLAFILCEMVTVAVSALLPATGAAGLAGLDAAKLLFHGATPLTDLFALRDGTMRTITVGEVGPIISFPSLHCSVAYLASAALWPLQRLRWAMIVLNVAMTVSAVTHGAHYLCDCLAGLLVAAMSFHVAGRLGPWSRVMLKRVGGSAVLSSARAAPLAT